MSAAFLVSPPRISIHALHEESDASGRLQQLRLNPFQSPLSMRRATPAIGNPQKERRISIHALHEESDLTPLTALPIPTDFNPRSP